MSSPRASATSPAPTAALPLSAAEWSARDSSAANSRRRAASSSRLRASASRAATAARSSLCPSRKLGRKGRGALADHRQAGVEQQPNADEILDGRIAGQERATAGGAPSSPSPASSDEAGRCCSWRRCRRAASWAPMIRRSASAALIRASAAAIACADGGLQRAAAAPPHRAPARRPARAGGPGRRPSAPRRARSCSAWSSGFGFRLHRRARRQQQRHRPAATGRSGSSRLSFAMIGMVRKDRCRAEQLLGKHRPDQQVRPGRRCRTTAGGRRRPAPASSWPSAAPIRNRASRLPPSRQLRACGRVRSTTAPCRARRGRSVTLLAARPADAAALGKLGHLGRPGDAFQIALDQLGFGRAADLSAGDDVQEHLACVEARCANGQVRRGVKPS